MAKVSERDATQAKSLVRSAVTTLSIVSASYQVWWLYASSDTRPKYLETMDRYSEFYRFDEEAHFRSIVIGLHTLFDGRGDTATIAKILKCSSLEKKSEIKIRKRLADLQPITSKIKTLRDKLFAHRDHQLGYSEVYKRAAITPNELRTVMSASIEIINEIAKRLGTQGFVESTATREDLEWMLRDLTTEDQS